MKKNPYFAKPGISNSHLNWILPECGGSSEMFEYYINTPPKDISGSAIDIGSALHKFIEVPDDFKIKVLDVPGPSSKAVIDILLGDTGVEFLPLTPRPKILAACDATGYQKAWKPDTRVDKIIAECSDYFNAIKTADDNTALMNAEEAHTVEIGMDILRKKSRIFSDLFYKPDTEILKEHEIHFMLNDVQCKALIDRLVINHREKWFYIEDLKTTSTFLPLYRGYNLGTDTDPVEGEMYKRHVHRQMVFYAMGVSTMYPDYIIRPAQILALETIAPYRYEEIIISPPVFEAGLNRVKFAIDEIKKHNLHSYSL